MTLIATIDPTACSAHGDCVAIAPTAFALDDDIATIIGTAPDDQLLAAAEACPVGAITVVDAETGPHVDQLSRNR